MLIHKTMKMPTSCLSCWIAPTCEVWVREKSKYKGYDNRLDECPLEEVVRCKDCYYCATEKSFGKEYLYCDAFYEHAEGDLVGVSLMVEPNHFCAWGERRKDDTVRTV